jgi:hypothetical protein
MTRSGTRRSSRGKKCDREARHPRASAEDSQRRCRYHRSHMERVDSSSTGDDLLSVVRGGDGAGHADQRARFVWRPCDYKDSGRRPTWMTARSWRTPRRTRVTGAAVRSPGDAGGGAATSATAPTSTTTSGAGPGPRPSERRGCSEACGSAPTAEVQSGRSR